MSNWYVVRCHPKSEQKASANLIRQGFQVYLPVYRKLYRHARKTLKIKAPLFPRYLFVRLDVAEDVWRPVKSTFGVSELVSQGEMPCPVPGGVVDALRAEEDEDGCIPLRNMAAVQPGDKVRVEEGPLASKIGLFEGLTDDHRVMLLLEMLGRPVKICLPQESLSPVS